MSLHSFEDKADCLQCKIMKMPRIRWFGDIPTKARKCDIYIFL
jgi:hypothetical protein